MVDFRVVIEGGGSTRTEQALLRQGFKGLFDKLIKNKRKVRRACPRFAERFFRELEKW
jgi:hypothetical protein